MTQVPSYPHKKSILIFLSAFWTGVYGVLIPAMLGPGLAGSNLCPYLNMLRTISLPTSSPSIFLICLFFLFSFYLFIYVYFYFYFHFPPFILQLTSSPLPLHCLKYPFNTPHNH